MPVEDAATNLFGRISPSLGIKAFFVLFLVFYLVFALMLFRQIQLGGKALPTSIVPFVRFMAIIHIGFSLALLLVVLGTF